ncbi:Chitinase 1 [Escovopsis weberi]|uniref:chitinase n=1 Tax=Escovopsis weberi TaxID=150374 RepID=A0A0N0RTN8_ESCWE|nr:Chitinase 1 [Escovopsis weberi]
MLSIPSLAAGLGFLGLIGGVQAGYNPSASNNIAVYWGQNSAAAPDVNIINLSFLTGLYRPAMNFANAGNNCTAIAGSDLMRCPQIEADIIECQQTYGKTILLSMAGATYTEGGFPSEAAAVAAANNFWSLFGPIQSGSTATRPFGNAVVDGFDFDFESTVNNALSFTRQLRQLTNSAGGKKFYLSTAPQCVYPDAADQTFLQGQVAMDLIQIQFYNNWCGVANFPTGWNFATWDNWAKTVSANPNVKILLGVPASPGAANAGSWPSSSQLSSAFSDAKTYSSFGGAMLWDMSQLYQNLDFLKQIVSLVGGGGASPSPQPPSSTPAPSPTTPPPSTAPTTPPVSSPTGGNGAGLPQWAQCGGMGYTGPTQCAAPYKCVTSSVWWSSCQ